MLSDEPSLSEQPVDGLSGPALSGGLLLCRLYIECGRFRPVGIRGGGGGIDKF